ENLLLLRDHMGVRPLYYSAGHDHLAFAAEQPRLQYEPPGLGQADIAGFLAAIAEYEPSLRGTGGICRVMPGECVIWHKGRAPRAQRYWQLGLTEIPHETAAEQFHALFDEAVRARLEGAKHPAAMLSGGLDSSAVALVAETYRAPLPVYSGLHPQNPDQDESFYIQKVLAAGNFLPHDLDRDALPPLALLGASLREQGGLFHAPGLPVSRGLYKAAAQDGVDVLLDGHGGDEVAWHGSSRLMELAAQNRWGQVLRLLPTHCRLYGENPLVALQIVAQNSGHARALPVRALRKANRLFSARGAAPSPAWWRLMRREVIEREDLADRWTASKTGPEACQSSDRANQLHALTAPLYAHAFEVFARINTSAGIETRYPFCDRRLIEFCLALPADEKFRPGETRSLLRRGLRHVLPPEIAKRQDKIDFLPVIRNGLAGPHRVLLEAMAQDATGVLGEWLEMERLRGAIESFLKDPAQSDGDMVLTLWRLASLHVWADISRANPEAAAQ
ncbi:MAG: asparagine synthase-related protein, partial [Mangrovicoccus sp.]|nr:asparagine synthase-related protein [Mangrovicoccus sp.]